MRTAEKVKILYGEADPQISAAQAGMFERAGYRVEVAVGRKAIQEALVRGGFEVVVLGHTLTKDDRHHLPYLAKKTNPETRVLVLHASGKHPKVDIALDSRRGESAVLQAIADLLLQSVEV